MTNEKKDVDKRAMNERLSEIEMVIGVLCLAFIVIIVFVIIVIKKGKAFNIYNLYLYKTVHSGYN